VFTVHYMVVFSGDATPYILQKSPGLQPWVETREIVVCDESKQWSGAGVPRRLAAETATYRD